jgi:hypothetical protein
MQSQSSESLSRIQIADLFIKLVRYRRQMTNHHHHHPVQTAWSSLGQWWLVVTHLQLEASGCLWLTNNQ